MFGIAFAIEEFYPRSNHPDTESGKGASNKDWVVCSQWQNECFMESTRNHLSIMVAAASCCTSVKEYYIHIFPASPLTKGSEPRDGGVVQQDDGLPNRFQLRMERVKAGKVLGRFWEGPDLSPDEHLWTVSESQACVFLIMTCQNVSALMAMMTTRCKLLTRTGFETNKLKQHEPFSIFP